MTKEEMQQIFDKVALHLLAQKQRSTTGGSSHSASAGVCAYRGEDGMKCAVGCLITDENYNHRLEGRSVTNPFVLTAVRRSLRIDLDSLDPKLNLLIDLQEIHDMADPSQWYSRLSELARTYELSTSTLEKV